MVDKSQAKQNHGSRHVYRWTRHAVRHQLPEWCEPPALQTELDGEGKGRKSDDFKFGPASDWDWDRFSGDEFA